MKKLKSFRLSDETIQSLNRLKNSLRLSETEIVERAVELYENNLSDDENEQLIFLGKYIFYSSYGRQWVREPFLIVKKGRIAFGGLDTEVDLYLFDLVFSNENKLVALKKIIDAWNKSNDEKIVSYKQQGGKK